MSIAEGYGSPDEIQLQALDLIDKNEKLNEQINILEDKLSRINKYCEDHMFFVMGSTAMDAIMKIIEGEE